MVSCLMGDSTALASAIVRCCLKNLLSVNRGWDFATVLHSLAEIGYHIEYGLLNSRFHGVPQNRERIYLVAYRHFRAEGGRKVFHVTAGDGKALIQRACSVSLGSPLHRSMKYMPVRPPKPPPSLISVQLTPAGS